LKSWNRWPCCNVCRCGLYEDERTYCQDCKAVVESIYADKGHARKLLLLGPAERAEREARIEAHRWRVEREESQNEQSEQH
jgi:hypothetical protein